MNKNIGKYYTYDSKQIDNGVFAVAVRKNTTGEIALLSFSNNQFNSNSKLPFEIPFGIYEKMRQHFNKVVK